MIVDDNMNDINIFELPQHPKVRFGREATLEEDIMGLMTKWKGHKNEVLVHHMRDALKIFLHNKNQYDNYIGHKVSKRIFTISHPTYNNDGHSMWTGHEE